MRVSDDDLDECDDLIYYKGRLFTGCAVDYHRNGTLAAEIEYVAGLTQGFWREWTSSGVLVMDSECKNGVRHGITRTYFDNAKLQTQAYYEYGIETAFTEWGSDGKIMLSRELGPNSEGGNYMLLERFRSRTG